MSLPEHPCEHYDVEIHWGRDGRPRPGSRHYCLAESEPDSDPPRCEEHRGTITGEDRHERDTT